MIPELTFQEELIHTTKEVLERMGFQAEVQVKEAAEKDGRTTYMIEVALPEGQSLLIGQHGAHIAALLHIVRLVVRKSQPKDSMLALDINRYFEEKKTYLEREALESAKEVEITSLPVMLRPMLPFERKMIHTLFSEHPTITTESVGRGEDRKVLLRRRAIDTPEEDALLS